MDRGGWIGLVACAAGGTALLVPASIWVANRTGMVDRPHGWKQHSRSTPQLGGAAVIAGIAAATLAFAPDPGRLAPILWISLALLVVGIVDDRVTLRATPRLMVELAAGAVLWKAGLGWELDASGAVNLVLTILWVVGVINAVNLLDLMDGVTSAVAVAIASGCVALAASGGDDSIAALSVATAAACAAFLPFNLSSPAKVFLGDGGTMPLGFILAALTTGGLASHTSSPVTIAAAACLAGVPLFDMVVRVVLRRSRGIPLLTAGPDSLANRLGDVVGSPRSVSLTFATVQLGLSALTVSLIDDRPEAVLTVLVVAVGAGAAAAVALHRSVRNAGAPLPAAQD